VVEKIRMSSLVVGTRLVGRRARIDSARLDTDRPSPCPRPDDGRRQQPRGFIAHRARRAEHVALGKNCRRPASCAATSTGALVPGGPGRSWAKRRRRRGDPSTAPDAKAQTPQALFGARRRPRRCRMVASIVMADDLPHQGAEQPRPEKRPRTTVAPIGARPVAAPPPMMCGTPGLL